MQFKKNVLILMSIPFVCCASESCSCREENGQECSERQEPASIAQTEMPVKKVSCASLCEPTLAVRAAYFQFNSSWARKIYGTGGADVELEGSIKLYPCLSFWGNLNYVWKKGCSMVFKYPTHLDLVTLSIGVNRFIPLQDSSLSFYVGLGISGAYAHTKDSTEYLHTNTSRGGVGGVVKLGILTPCVNSFFFNPFFDYYYQPIRARKSGMHSRVNLGGFRTGLGLVYHF